jgi:hypothetical protein
MLGRRKKSRKNSTFRSRSSRSQESLDYSCGQLYRVAGKDFGFQFKSVPNCELIMSRKRSGRWESRRWRFQDISGPVWSGLVGELWSCGTDHPRRVVRAVIFMPLNTKTASEQSVRPGDARPRSPQSPRRKRADRKRSRSKNVNCLTTRRSERGGISFRFLKVGSRQKSRESI